jgi:osmoprotectant transport system substrate-binding protein
MRRKAPLSFLRRIVQRGSSLDVLVVLAYEFIILFLLVVSVGFDADRSVWRLGPITAVTIVLALLLFLPVLLPRITSLSLPFFTGQASIQFRDLENRLEVQKARVELLSNETDRLLNTLAANVLTPDWQETRDTLIVGCQRGLEQRVTGALLQRLLQHHLSGRRKRVFTLYDQGGSALNYLSLYRGKVDICPAYTWQGFEMSLGPSLQYSAEELMGLESNPAIAKLNSLYERSGLRWLSYLGFASNWELVMLTSRAGLMGIDTLDDLPSRSSRLTLGCPREFFARDAAYGSLERSGNEFRKVEFLEGGELYDALSERSIDVAVGFSTDPRLASPDYTRLETPERWCGNYYAVPVAREEILERYPDVAQCIERLGAALVAPPKEGEKQGIALKRMRELVKKAEGSGGGTDAVERIVERFLAENRLI